MIKEKRELKGITQLELSKRTGINLSLLQKLERGERNINICKLGNLVKISQVLKCKISDLLTDEKLKEECKKVELWKIKN